MHVIANKSLLRYIKLINFSNSSVTRQFCCNVIPFYAIDFSCSLNETTSSFSLLKVSFEFVVSSSITVTLSKWSLWITPSGVFLLGNLATFVGFITLHTVQLFIGVTVDLAKANCNLCNFTDGSIIARSGPNWCGTITGIKASDFGGIKTASVVRKIVSVSFNKFVPTKSL